MSGKRRRSWEKMAPHSKSNDGGWEGNFKNDDISRGRDRNIRSFHNDWETHYTTTTTRKPYRSRGREWETYNKSCSNEYSRRRDDVRKEFCGARSQRDDQSNSKSRQISNIQCKFFAAGKCYRDDCRFSHHNPRSHDTWQPHADRDDDDEEIQRSHNKPSWDWDDLDNKKRSWNGRPWDDDDHDDGNKTKSWNGNGTYSMDDKHRNDNNYNNNTHLNQNANVLDTSGKGQVEIEKSPKKKQEEVVGNLQDGSYEKSRSTRDKFTANNEYGRDDDDDDVRNNSRNLKERPRYTHDRNPRNHYDDHDDDGRRCHPSKIPCKFFSEGKCYRDDCKFSHDSENNNNKSWSGPSWDDVNGNSQDKKKSWDDDTKKPSAIHDLNSLPSNQDTTQEGKLGNDENGKKQEVKVKVKEGNTGSDEDKCMRHFRAALVECVKEILKPIWKEGKMTREVYKTVVKKVVDKITTTIQQNQIPPTQPKIHIYLTHSQPKIMKLVEAYVEKLVKA